MPKMPPFLVGKRCYLRGLTADDATDRYLNWLHDEAITRYLEAGRRPTTPDELRAYIQEHHNRPDSILLGICDQHSGQHIGNITLNHIHPVHRRADLGILIGEKTFWGQGYGTEATFLMVDYGFRRLNLHSIWLGVMANNHAAIRAYEKVGFSHDGVDRQAWWSDGRYQDVLRMSLLAHEHLARLAPDEAL